jgi:hypothetical protein
MKRLLYPLLLSLFLAIPAHTLEIGDQIITIPPDPPSLVLHDDSGKKYTIRTPDMDYYDFLRAADAMVLAAVPEWYVVGTPELPIIVQASPNLLQSRYGEAWRDDQGVYHVRIGRLGLMLATVEDLASVMLHEYVHVLSWEGIEGQPWSENCMSARQELMANKIVIEHYILLGYTPHMLRNSYTLYSQAQFKALLNQCPAEVTSDLPDVPVPIVSSEG